MIIGILLAALSGALLGICFTPMRHLKDFAWENTWFTWNLFACLLISPFIAWFTIPSLLQVFQEIGLQRNLIVLGVGLLSGASGVAFGLGLARVGTALVNSLCNGVALIAGSFVPLIAHHRDALQGQVGTWLAVGFALSVVGVWLCALAGSQRDGPSQYMSADTTDARQQQRLVRQGIALAVMAGLLTPLVNFGLAFGDSSMQIAREHGASETFMSFAIYLPFFATAFVANSLYCAFLWRKNDTLQQFAQPYVWPRVAIAFLIAALWMAGNVLYGWALPWMQSYGPVLGWPICLASCNIAAALVECAYGDWRGKPLVTLSGGLGMLTASLVTFAYICLLIQSQTSIS